MTNQRKWNDLSPRTRRVILVAGGIETVLKIAALVDLRRRPSSEVRGSKVGWAAAIIAINSAGIAPIIYFRRGRRRA